MVDNSILLIQDKKSRPNVNTMVWKKSKDRMLLRTKYFQVLFISEACTLVILILYDTSLQP